MAPTTEPTTSSSLPSTPTSSSIATSQPYTSNSIEVSHPQEEMAPSTESSASSRLARPTFWSIARALSRKPSNAQKTLTKFTLFPKLPIELRYKIWEHAIPIPEHLEVSGRVSDEAEPDDTWCDHFGHHICQDKYGEHTTLRLLQFWSPYHATNVLRACHEARKIGLDRLPNVIPSGWPNIAIRYNPTETTVFINNFDEIGWDLYGMNDDRISMCEQYSYKFKGIRKVPLDSQYFSRHTWGRKTRSEWLAILSEMFHDLEAVVVVLDPEEIFFGAQSKRYAEIWHKYFAEDADFGGRRVGKFQELQFYEGKLQTWYEHIPNPDGDSETEDDEDEETEGEEDAEVEVGEDEEIVL